MKEINIKFEEVNQEYDYYELITSYSWAEVSFELCANIFTLSRLDPSTLYYNYNNDKYYQIVSGELIAVLPYDKVVMMKKEEL